jgi:ankyrin repeat protein
VGVTPLHVAVFNDNRECALILVERGADVTVKDKVNKRKKEKKLFRGAK